MQEGFLSEYFEGVVVKRLSAVESNPSRSNQHEFNGVAVLRQLLGDERLRDMPTRFVWLGEESEGVSADSTVTWYDARENHPKRTEYRLYFRPNVVMDLAREVFPVPDCPVMTSVIPVSACLSSGIPSPVSQLTVNTL